MKKIISLILALTIFIMSICVFTVSAETIFTSGDYSYTLISGDTEAEILSYSGSESSLVLPSTLNGYPVTSIANSAFEASSISSVTVPEGVTNISQFAFAKCDNLITVVLPSTLTYLGLSAFYESYSLENVNLEDTSITGVNMMTFSGCTYLEKIALPTTCAGIYSGAFANCISLESVFIPREVQTIFDNAFSGSNYVTVTGYHESFADTFCAEKEIDFIPLSATFVMGDADGDNDVRIHDCTYIQKILASFIYTNDHAEIAGDVDEDGKLNIVDVTMIQKYLARMQQDQPLMDQTVTKYL